LNVKSPVVEIDGALRASSHSGLDFVKFHYRGLPCTDWYWG